MMRIIKLILTIGIALVAGWYLFEGLREIYYSNYFIGGILLFQTVPILALVIGYWLAPGEGSHPESAGRLFKDRSLKFSLGVALVVWLVLTATFLPALWRPQLREYGQAQPPWLAAWLAPSLSARLVFTTFDGIQMINNDGSLTQLSPSENNTDRHPVWSPDGQRIAFVSEGDDNRHLYVINADGSDLTPLTESPSLDTSPQWSPDGQRIVFIAEGNNNRALYVINADGADLTRLTEDFEDEDVLWLSFEWSPDGSRLVVIPDRRGNDHPTFYIINANGSDRTRMADNPISGTSPQWSPDGGRLSFISKRDGHPALYVMNADGANLTRLTEEVTLLPATVTVVPGSHQWSPNGQQIVFAGWPDDQAACPAGLSCSEIYVVSVDGQRQTRLTRTTAVNKDPIWSPDGQQIIFISNRDYRRALVERYRLMEIYVMNSDGSQQARLTFNYFPENGLMWAPSSERE